jgi:biotin-(acetyl-CoA carboxylase) ligase
LQKQGFSYFQAFYETLLAFKGEIITLKDGQSSLQGVCHSITQDGKLNLQLSNGQFIAIYAGEIKPYD